MPSFPVLLLGVGMAAQAQQAPADSLTLEEALELARRHSPVVAAADAAVAEAEAGGSGARARRGPRLSIDATYLR